MELIEINDENAEEFAEFINEDMQEDLARTFFRGIGAKDDAGDTKGAIVYELKGSESENDTLSRVHMFEAADEETKKLIMEEYKNQISDEDVTESFYESSEAGFANDLKSCGFSMQESESLDIIVSLNDIRKILSALNIKKMPSHIMSLSKASVMQYRGFIKNCLFKGQKGLLEDLAYLPMKWFEREFSSIAVTDDKVDGALLVRKLPSGMLYVGLYVAFGPDYKKNLALLMANSAQKIVELYPDGTQVLIRRHNDTVRKLSDRIFAGIKGATVFKGERAED